MASRAHGSPPGDLVVDARMPPAAPRPAHRLLQDPHGIEIGAWTIAVKKSHILKAHDAEK